MPEESMGGEQRELEGVNSVETPESQVTPESQPERVEQQSEQGAEGSEGKYNEILSKVTTVSSVASSTDADVKADAKSVADMTDEETKIQKLIDLANTKGVVHAVKVARSLNDYYALDRVHDDLADKLYDGLLERGLITKE